MHMERGTKELPDLQGGRGRGRGLTVTWYSGLRVPYPISLRNHSLR